MRAKMGIRAGLALLVAIAAGLSVQAGGGRKPIHAPTTITQSGHYYLTRDVNGQIAIDADEVILDLNGWLVDAVDAITIANSVKSVVIRNGRIGGFDGIVAPAGASVTEAIVVEGVVFDSNEYAVDLRDTESVTIRHCTVRDGELRILGDVPTRVRIEDNVISSPGSVAIDVRNAAGGVILRNVIAGLGGATGGRGIDVRGHGVLIADNSIQGAALGSSSSGVRVNSDPPSDDSGHTVRGNTIEDIGGPGVEIFGNGNRVVDNHITNCAEAAIDVNSSDYNYLARNTVLLNAVGIDIAFIANDTLVESNVSCGNAVNLSDSSASTRFIGTNTWCVP